MTKVYIIIIVQATPSFPTDTNNTTLKEVLPPCSDENDNSNQPQPDENNLTSLSANNNNNMIDSQSTSEPQCNSFKPKTQSASPGKYEYYVAACIHSSIDLYQEYIVLRFNINGMLNTFNTPIATKALV